MLHPCWYLPDVDWFAQLRTAPRLADDSQAVIGQLDRMLRVEPSFGPAATVTATHATLIGVEHLGDTMAYAAGSHDLIEMARLLCGLNLITAHLTQTIQCTAVHVAQRAFPDLTSAPDDAVHALADNLSTAGAAGEILAGHLKEAHLTLRHLTA